MKKDKIIKEVLYNIVSVKELCKEFDCDITGDEVKFPEWDEEDFVSVVNLAKKKDDSEVMLFRMEGLFTEGKYDMVFDKYEDNMFVELQGNPLTGESLNQWLAERNLEPNDNDIQEAIDKAFDKIESSPYFREDESPNPLYVKENVEVKVERDNINNCYRPIAMVEISAVLDIRRTIKDSCNVLDKAIQYAQEEFIDVFEEEIA